MDELVTVITPVYNERETIVENISRIEKCLSSIQIRFEIIIVDDNSPDGSGLLAEELAERYGNIKVLHRPEKRGLGTAYKDAFPLASGDLIVSMDSNLSHDPEAIPLMLREAETSDIVIGSRLVKGGSILGRPVWRDFLSVSANFFIRLFSGLRIHDWTSGFRVYRRGAWERIMPRVRCIKWDFQFEALYRAVQEGYRVREVPITFRERAEGKSKFSVKEALHFVYSFIKILSTG